MKIAIVMLSFSSILLFSCQKEVDFETPQKEEASNTGGDKLVKTVQKTGADSVVTVFLYDANGRLIHEKSTGVEQGKTINTELRYYRNTSGLVSRMVLLAEDLKSVGVDSLINTIHFNSASKYTSKVFSVDIPGFNFTDSFTFVYDASGKITSSDLFEATSGVAYGLGAREKYTYSSNGNVIKYDIDNIDQTGTEIPLGSTVYNYDDKSNALFLSNEAIVLSRPDWLSAGNMVSGQLTNFNDPSGNQTVTVTYTYNTNNRPATSQRTLMPGNTVSNTTYYYE